MPLFNPPDPASFDINLAVKKEQARADKDWTNFDAKGIVYLLGNKELNYYKIGLTRSMETPDARFRTIQQGTPFELNVVYYWAVSHARSFEQLLHHEFKERKIRGEWFRFSAEELPDIVVKIKGLAAQVPVIRPEDPPKDEESSPHYSGLDSPYQ